MGYLNKTHMTSGKIGGWGSDGWVGLISKVKEVEILSHKVKRISEGRTAADAQCRDTDVSGSVSY